jgi:hypothetical protein
VASTQRAPSSPTAKPGRTVWEHSGLPPRHLFLGDATFSDNRPGPREERLQYGSGLGDAIVKLIARWHGGKVWFESVLGQSSTFLPAYPVGQPDGIKKIKKRQVN